MIRHLSGFLLFLFFSNALGAPVYKSEDESGHPVFSDRAAESAEQIEIREPSTFKSSLYARKNKRVRSTPGNNNAVNDNFKYRTLAITSPEDGAAIRDNAGNIVLHFLVFPGIQQGHTIHLVMDGQVRSSLDGAASVSLQNVDRGTHQFHLEVTRTKDSKVIQTGPTTSVTLLRHSRRN